ncbi:DUF4198 domain-containing protein [Desulfovibrio sp. Huiquan2017]|uniref:DUF4198 domain-containing protein n=1 Tax=Desulfovibrio sp. Huiquan2017 TaxID=2816861 RepID=UPI002570B1BE|nr:DUF4198 domain-containing protein [Desulfovibrio sp. Huiquan2017]
MQSREFRGLLGMAALLVLLAVPDLASAHSLYILSGRHRVSEGKKSPLFFCYGHHFPVDDGVRAAKLASVSVHAPDGAVTRFGPRKETGLQSRMVEYAKPGVYVLTAETTPGYYTKWVDKKGRNRNTVKPMSAIKDQASSVVTALYSKQCAKTYVRCGEADGMFQARVGLPLELVPVQDPTALKPGDVLTLKIFMDGQRYFGPGHIDATYDGYSTEAEDLYLPVSETSGDTVTLSLDQPGRWFIRYYVKTPAPQGAKGDYLQQKRTATLVILVPNERRRPRPDHH